MNDKKKIHITINPVAGHTGDYVAHFRSEFLDAIYSVFFKDVYGVPPMPYRLSILGVPFPSLTYNFTF